MEYVIAPGGAYSASHNFSIDKEDAGLYQSNRLPVTLMVDAAIRDVLDREQPPQSFLQTVLVGPRRRELSPTHYQLAVKPME